MHGRWELSDGQWALLEPILRSKRRPDGKGRPPKEARTVRNGVLWILGTRAQWREIPETYPPYQTCHRRFQQWVRSGALAKALRKLARRLQAEGRLNLEEAFIDATFAAAKKGASGLVLPSVGKGTKITAITVGNSLAVAVSVQAASLHESQLVEEALGHSFLDQLPERLIGDKAYDSDKLDRQMQEQYGVQIIAPHRSNRARPTQDGRPLRRYRRRWTVERLFAWLQLFRRLVTRYEYHIDNFLRMVRLGCIKIMLRYS